MVDLRVIWLLSLSFRLAHADESCNNCMISEVCACIKDGTISGHALSAEVDCSSGISFNPNDMANKFGIKDRDMAEFYCDFKKLIMEECAVGCPDLISNLGVNNVDVPGCATGDGSCPTDATPAPAPPCNTCMISNVCNCIKRSAIFGHALSAEVDCSSGINIQPSNMASKFGIEDRNMADFYCDFKKLFTENCAVGCPVIISALGVNNWDLPGCAARDGSCPTDAIPAPAPPCNTCMISDVCTCIKSGAIFGHALSAEVDCSSGISFKPSNVASTFGIEDRNMADFYCDFKKLITENCAVGCPVIISALGVDNWDLPGCAARDGSCPAEATPAPEPQKKTSKGNMRQSKKNKKRNTKKKSNKKVKSKGKVTKRNRRKPKREKETNKKGKTSS